MKTIPALLILIANCAPCLGGDNVARIQFQGNPMFMIGVYAHPAGPAGKAVLDDLSRAGFNTLLVPPTTSDEVFAEMDRLGIRAMVTTGYNTVLPSDDTARSARIDQIKKMVASLKDKPALLGWEGPDEPIWNWKNPYQKDGEKPTWQMDDATQKLIHGNVDALKDGYALVKSLDPDHPVFLNFAPRSEIAELQWFTSRPATGGYRSDGRAAADVFGVDIYPVPGGGGNNGLVKGIFTPSIGTVGAFTRKQREVAGDAPMYMVLQGCGILDWDPKEKEHAQRHPCFADERFMIFQAVANGANGILWWGANYVSPDSQLWSDIKRVARQLASLEPILAAGEVAPANCSSSQIELIRYTYKGRSYVIAVNASDEAVDCASFGWHGLTTAPVNVVFEDRTVSAVGGKFRDNFEPFAVHVYSDDFSSAATTTDKVRCTFGLPLSVEPLKDKTHAEVARSLKDMGIDAVCALPEDKNLIRELHRAGIKVYAEMTIFAGQGHWKDHPESHPINAQGEPIDGSIPGYCGVCPNQDYLRTQILDKVTSKFSMFEYDGLWLDFIRYPGKWEQKDPVIEQTCFCDVCLDKFAAAKGISYPRGLKTSKDKAQWILANHRRDWTDFRCQSITDFVGEIKSEMTRLNHEAILAIFNVPWRPSDFDGAITDILAQDIRALAEHVDVFSPMVYHEMCHFPRSWVADYTDYVWETTGRQVWPIVQVCDEPVEMTPEDVFQTLRTGMNAHGSTGIVMYAFRHALDDEAKLNALKEAFRR